MSALSVAIYTYAQERFVGETLDSLLSALSPARAKETEIVVSDDASPDGTADVVASWFARHGDRFASCRLLRSETKEGPVRNYVRAVRSCSGDVVKPLAGDDIFCPGGLDAVTGMMDDDPDVAIAFGKVIAFTDRPGGTPPEWTREQRSFFSSDARGQFRMLASFDPLPAPGVFFRKSLFEECRLWDYQFFWMEDWPLWLLATIRGRRIAHLDAPAVYYRRHDASLTRRMSAPGKDRVRVGVNRDRRIMYDAIILPRAREFGFSLRRHVRLRRFFFAWMESTRRPGLVNLCRELSLLVDPHRMARKASAVFSRFFRDGVQSP